MSSTALGTEGAKKVTFISDGRKKFYYEKLEEIGY